MEEARGIQYGDRREAPIGVFDSGVGGLTVVREILHQLPAERITYFGDTARVPYGSKSRETIIRYSRQIIRFLMTRGVKAIVVACNTASAYALEELRPQVEVPIIGVVKPGAKMAAAVTRNGKIGVIGTEGTISSGIYTSFLKDLRPDMQVLGKACPLFVPLAEEGWLEGEVPMLVARSYLEELCHSGIDTLILGCTHYPLLRPAIAEVMGPEVTLVNPAYETAVSLQNLLQEQGLRSPGIHKGTGPLCEFFVSDAADWFNRFAGRILPAGITNTRQIPIEEY
ncbi:MAG: glutamate racemase [Lachnospiraceae bacterium]|nr:glutamate racemase [Lachnospiraceae bacterium]